MKKIRSLSFMIIISLMLVSCKGAIKADRTVKVEYIYDDGKEKIEEYDYLYDDGNDSDEISKFTSNFDLDKVEIVALEFDEDLKEKEILNTYNLKAGETLFVRAVHPEGIPMIKIRWEVDGKKDEYILQYNGKDGMEELVEYEY